MKKIMLGVLLLLSIAPLAFADGQKYLFTCQCLAPDGTTDANDVPNYFVLGTVQLSETGVDEAEYFARRTCITKFRNVDAFSSCKFAN